MKILKGDTVKVLIGKDKNRSGTVVASFPRKTAVVVKGLNMFKKHIKASQGKPGSIIEKERALQVSKIILVCPNCQKSTRVGYEIDKSGDKYRICKKCKTIIQNKVIKK
ncbi:MAG: 50S ribosomal protein L24 [Candidatus Shapirobacteria bacterium]|jgi:large subunit ribosomal protein L24